MRWEKATVGPLLLGLLFALPTLVVFYPPMTDLPNHEATVALLRHFGDAAWWPPGLYELNLLHTNQLFYFFGWALSLVTSTRWAMKIVVALAQVAIFHAAGRLLRHLGREVAPLLLLAPIALGFTYYWGFVANLFGFAALFYALPDIDRLAERPTRKRAALACGHVLVTYLAHGSSFVVLLPIVVAFALLRPNRWGGRALALAPALFGAIVGVLGRWRSEAHFTSAVPREMTLYMPLEWKLGKDFSLALFGVDGEGCLVAGALGLCALGVWRLRRPWRPSGLREVVVGGRYLLLAGLMFAAYLLSPATLDGASYVHQRFLGPAFALLVVALAPPRESQDGAKTKPLFRLSCVAAMTATPIAVALTASPWFAFADHEHQVLERLLLRLPTQRALTFLAIERIVHEPPFKIRVAGARYVALRGGRALPSFTISPIAPVQISPRYRWDNTGARTYLVGSKALVPTWDLDYFEWVVARFSHRVDRDVVEEAFRPDAVLVDEEEHWVAFRSTRERQPLLSLQPTSDRWLLPSLGPSIFARALAVEERRRQGASPASSDPR